MGDWIKSRGVNGEYGYLNIKTGEFSTTLPQSEQQQQQDIYKYNQYALKQYGYRKLQFDKTDGKIRNHSDETLKRYVNVPIIVRNPDGTFSNIYTKQVAQYESPMKIVSPEFDILTAITGVKPARKVLDIATRKRTFTGVPHRMKSDGTFMDESFLTTGNKFDIWTSDSPDFVTQYASNGGQRFAIFGKSNKLFNLPRLNRKIMMNWEDMPYQVIDGKIIVNPNIKITSVNNITGKQLNKTYKGKLYQTPEWKAKLDKLIPFPEPEVTTDQLFKAIPSKYQGIKFKNLMDGPTIINGKYYNIPVNEWVYKANADVIKAPFQTTHLDLMKNDLIDVITKGSTIVGHNVVEQYDK